MSLSGSSSAREALKRYFGYAEFRLTQEQVVERTLAGRCSLVIMPTGGGKSICYQLPGVLLDGLTIVVSPLIALMQDQVSALTANGIEAAALNSACEQEQEREIIRLAETNALKLLYVSPERAVSSGFLGWVGRLNVAQVAIDEAHCVSMWGNDFRPEYTQLRRLLSLFPSVPVVALTATADGATRHDILQQLALPDCKVFLSSFERKNIKVEVLPAQNRIKVMLKFLGARSKESGIVYCLSRKSTEQTAQKLRQAGYEAAHYHAALPADERRRVQESFQRDEIQVVCATIAFGMGIDKPNIRWVIHYNLPKNIESYYQEIGRSGRDGESAEALLFAGYSDMRTLKQFIDNGDGNEQFKGVQDSKLQRMWDYTQSTSCRTNFILGYFGEHREAACGHCDNCLHPPVTFDGSVLAQKALSACYRLKQEVGLNMMIDVLRGSASQEVLRRGFDKVSTYGVGRDVDWKHWRHYITQLIDRGFLAIDFTRHNAIVLTELSRGVLKGETNVKLCEPQEVDFKSKALQEEGIELPDNELLIVLKDLRKQIAERNVVKAYSVFSDASLKDMALKKPGSIHAFMGVSGVGTFKADKYAEEFLAAVASQVPLEQRQMASDVEVKSARTKSKSPANDFVMGRLSSTHLATLELYEHGSSVSEIVSERGLSRQTIEGHLYRLQMNGRRVDVSDLISPEQIDYIQDLWRALDQPMRIKMVHSESDGSVNYEQIRYAVCLLNAES